MFSSFFDFFILQTDKEYTVLNKYADCNNIFISLIYLSITYKCWILNLKMWVD
jgi:hypothetical protein